MGLLNTRKCVQCDNTKELKEFEQYKRSYGLAYRKVCIECTSELRKIPKIKCQECNDILPRESFPKSRNAAIGVEQTCKSCKKELRIASGVPQIIARGRKGRYKSDPEFRERLKAHAKNYRVNNKERHLLSQAKIRARRKNLDFNITIEDIVIPTHCPILGVKLVTNNTKRLWDSASLDKVDNDKGYVKGNVRVISYLANHLKGKATRQELEMFAKNIILYLDNMI